VVKVLNGVILGINDMHVVKGADIKVTPEEIRFEMGKPITVA